RTLQKLKANMHYRLELVAYNELGPSEPAAIIFRTPQSSELPDDEDYDGFPINVSSVPVGLIAGKQHISRRRPNQLKCSLCDRRCHHGYHFHSTVDGHLFLRVCCLLRRCMLSLITCCFSRYKVGAIY